jgi:hypothetical protein
VRSLSSFTFLKGKEINFLYITLSLSYFGSRLVGVFVPIYLWTLGYELWQILSFLALESVWFIVGTFVFLPFLRGVSDRMLMFISVPLLVLFFTGLPFLLEFPLLFFVLPLIHALDRLCFDVGYALDFARASDKGCIGRELGMQSVILTVATFSAPFLGAYIGDSFGFPVLFTVATVVLLTALIPLFFFRPNHISLEINGRLLLRYIFYKQTIPHTLSCVAYALESLMSRYLWSLYIFTVLGSLQILGLIISLGLFVGGIAQYLSGYVSDRGGRGVIFKIFVPIYSLVWILRTFTTTLFSFTAAHIGGGLVLRTFEVSWSTYNYELAKLAPHPGVFILSRILLYHIARACFWPILIVLSYVLPVKTFFISSFIIAALLTLLYFTVLRQRLDKKVFAGICV